MPRAVAESLFHRLIDSFPPRRVYTPAAFAHEPMPAAVAHFLQHWLRHRLRHEARSVAVPHSEWFDFEHASVQQAHHALVKALIASGHFPVAAWEASLREAVQQVTAYLVRPVTTLGTFIFQENKPALPVEVLTWRLGYFKEYSYFHEAARVYAEKHEGTEIKQERFAELLRTVDYKMTEAYDAAAWLNLLAPLFDLTRRAGIGDGVPVPLLMAFFEDKDAEVIYRRLARHRQHGSTEALDEDRLRHVIEGTEEPIPVVAPSSMPAVAADQAQGPVPRWKQFQLQQSAPPQPAPKPQPSRGFSPTPDEARPLSQDARPRWMQYREDETPPPPASTTASPASPPGPTELARLEEAVLGEAGTGLREMFVNHLFARSLDTYEQVLRRLHATASWSDASKIIAEDVFRTFKVNIYSDPAILFTDTVEAGYLKREA